jgi:hypothetical protein
LLVEHGFVFPFREFILFSPAKPGGTKNLFVPQAETGIWA